MDRAIEAPVKLAGTPLPARLKRWITPLVIPLALLLAWDLGVRMTGTRLIPLPRDVAIMLYDFTFGGIYDDAFSKTIHIHFWKSVQRVYGGFFAAAAVGIPLGLLIGRIKVVRDLLDPTLQALRAIPSIAWVPLFILWFGIFEASKVALIAVGVFFPVYLGVYGAVVGVDRRIVEVGRVFRLSGFELIRLILLPAVLPDFILALRAGLGLGWMFVVAAEFMGASEGLGYLLVDGQQLGKPDQILAAILIFAVVGKATDSLLLIASAPFLRWRDTHASGI